MRYDKPQIVKTTYGTKLVVLYGTYCKPYPDRLELVMCRCLTSDSICHVLVQDLVTETMPRGMRIFYDLDPIQLTKQKPKITVEVEPSPKRKMKVIYE